MKGETSDTQQSRRSPGHVCTAGFSGTFYTVSDKSVGICVKQQTDANTSASRQRHQSLWRMGLNLEKHKLLVNYFLITFKHLDCFAYYCCQHTE